MSDPLDDLELPRRQPTSRTLLWSLWGRETVKDLVLLLAALPEWTAESVGVALHDAAAALGIGMGKVAQPLRVAITGTQVSPDIGHTVYLAGRDEALARIDAALAMVPAEG